MINNGSPLLRLLLPLATGIGVGELAYPQLAVLPHVGGWIWAGAVGSLLLAVLGWRSPSSRAAVGQQFLLALGVFLFGGALLLGERRAQAVDWTTEVPTRRAVVAEPPKPTDRAWRARLRLVDGGDSNRWVDALLVGRDTPLRLGDGVIFHAKILPLDAKSGVAFSASDVYLRRQGVSGKCSCFASEWRVVESRFSLTVRERALLLRERLVMRYRRHFSAHDMGVLAAMTLGDRRFLDPATRQLYARTGASHVLALSGLHLSILYVLYQLLVVLPARRRNRLLHVVSVVAGCVGIWLFAFLTGFPTSLVRACLMFTIAQGVSLLSHRAPPLHALVLAALLMLVYHPSWLFDVGFQLSCSAVGGILLLRPLLPTPATLRWSSSQKCTETEESMTSFFARIGRRGLRVFYEMGAVSLSAQVVTAPLVAYHFHLLPLQGWLGNFFVIPAAYLLLFGTLLFFLVVPLREVLAELLSSVVQAVEQVLCRLADFPHATLEVWLSPFSLALVYLLLLLGVLWWTNRARWRPIFPFSVLCGLLLVLHLNLLWEERSAATVDPHVCIYRRAGVTAVHCVAPDGGSLFLASDTLKARRFLMSALWREGKVRGKDHVLLPLSWLQSAEGCCRLQRWVSERSGGSPAFAFAPRVILVGQRRFAVVGERLSWAFPRQPLSVDRLVLLPSCRTSPAHAVRFFRPRKLLIVAQEDGTTEL